MFPIVSLAAFLSGCWVPPSADVRPVDKPGVVEAGIEAERVADSARVESVDRAAGTLTFSEPGIPITVCRIGRTVRHWDDIRAGDKVRATLREVLTVYVASATAGGSPDAAVRSRYRGARVLLVDPSYRLLTVRYPSGGTEIFKVALHTHMQGIEAGDSVAIRPLGLIELRVRRHSNREGSRPGSSAAPAR